MGYPQSVKENCLKMYVNGLGFRAIERVSGVNHNTIIRWVKASANNLPSAPSVEEIPQRTCPHVITEIDELQTKASGFCRVKKNKRWIWTTVNHWKPGILALVLGDRDRSNI